MQFILTIAILCLGLIVGSFVSAWVFRLSTGRSIIYGRSACMSCNVTLRWYELVPVASFLLLRGKCRSCATSIPRQDLLLEVVMGGLFALIYVIFGLTLQSVLLALGIVFLVALSAYDFRHTIIPDQFVGPFIILGGIAAVLSPAPIEYILAGLFSGLFFVSLWFVSGGRWMGLGDGKLAVGIGLFLGPALSVSAIMFAFWAGAIVSLILLALTKWGRVEFSLKSHIPFAPFLAFGFLFALFSNISFFPWI
ncbi:MAG: prepilin peptidase [Candidatus Paceibacterota bacterium]